MVTTLTVNDLPQIQAFGGRIGGLMDLIGLVKKLKISVPDLMRLVDTVQQISLEPATKGKVLAALEAMTIIAQATETDTDDKIVATISSVLSGKTLDLLCTVVDAWLGGKSLAMATIEADVTAQSVDYLAFLEIAKLVFQLIRSRKA